MDRCVYPLRVGQEWAAYVIAERAKGREPAARRLRLAAVNRVHPRLVAVAVVVALGVIAAGCAGGASTVPSPSPSTGPVPSAVPSATPSAAPSNGPIQPKPSIEVPPFPALPDGQPTNVVPRPGTLDVHNVAATHIAAALNGRRLFVRLAWWSGVEPCHVLDSIVLDRDGTNLHLTIREGTTDPNAICIEIAMLKSTIVDLGELEPGTYTVSAFGEAAPVSVEVK